MTDEQAAPLTPEDAEATRASAEALDVIFDVARRHAREWRRLERELRRRLEAQGLR